MGKSLLGAEEDPDHWPHEAAAMAHLHAQETGLTPT